MSLSIIKTIYFKFKKKRRNLYRTFIHRIGKKVKYTREFGLELFHVFSKNSLTNMIIRSGLEAINIESIKEPSSKYINLALARKKI